MITGALFLAAAAAALPLGVWPEEAGPPLTVVDGVELYVAEPAEDYWIVAVQPLSPPLEVGETAYLGRIAATAARLGVDAVLLLAELPEEAIPADHEEALEPTERFSVAVFLNFEGVPQETSPRLAQYPRSPAPVQPARLGERSTTVTTPTACGGVVHHSPPPVRPRRVRI